MSRRISYLECTMTRKNRGGSGWTIFLLGFGLGGICVYGVTKFVGLH